MKTENEILEELKKHNDTIKNISNKNDKKIHCWIIDTLKWVLK